MGCQGPWQLKSLSHANIARGKGSSSGIKVRGQGPGPLPSRAFPVPKPSQVQKTPEPQPQRPGSQTQTGPRVPHTHPGRVPGSLVCLLPEPREEMPFLPPNPGISVSFLRPPSSTGVALSARSPPVPMPPVLRSPGRTAFSRESYCPLFFLCLSRTSASTFICMAQASCESEASVCLFPTGM